MKILFHTTSKQEADNVKYSLEAKGVPIFIANDSSGPALGYINADRYTVWVYLDGQHDDAASFLQNEDNQITSPVDVDEFYLFLDKEKNGFRQPMDGPHDVRRMCIGVCRLRFLGG